MRSGRISRDRIALQARFARRFGRDDWHEAFETLRLDGESIHSIAHLGGVTPRTLYRWLAEQHSVNVRAVQQQPESVA